MKGAGETPPDSSQPAFELSADDRRTLARMFNETSHADLDHLGCGLQQGDFAEVLHRVHRLHGAALTVGASALVMQLEGFEAQLRKSEQIPADSHERLLRLRQSLRDYLQQ